MPILIQFVPEIEVGAAACTELGRATRCYVSGYDRARAQVARLVRGESRCLVADLNGAIGAARTVTSVTWRVQLPYIARMSNARIDADAREVAVDVLARYPGCTPIKCEATLDNGEVYVQLFSLRVRDAAWFDGENDAVDGPTVLRSP